jgi:hypothetical protein
MRNERATCAQSVRQAAGLQLSVKLKTSHHNDWIGLMLEKYDCIPTIQKAMLSK